MLFVSSCLIAFSGVFIKASAEPLQISKMSIADTRAFFGDSFPAKIRWTGASTWRDTTFIFDYSASAPSIQNMNLAQNFFADSAAEFADYDILVYHCAALDADAHDLLIDLPMYFPDYAVGAFAVSNRLNGWSWSGISDSVNSISSYPDNWYTDFDAVSAREPSTAYGAFSYHPPGGTLFWRLFPYQCDSDGTFFSSLSVQSVQAFYDDGYKLQLMIFCPHIGSTPQHSEPVVTTVPVTTAPSGTGDINVNVDVDLTETNSILTTIANGISGFFQVIIDALSDLFLPDEDYVKNWANDVKDLLESHFFGTGVNVDPLIDAFEDLATYGATTSIRFPGIDLDIANTNFSISAKSVDLRPMEDSGIYGYIEIAINIAATLSVFNLVQRKIKAILVGERVVEVEGDDD